MAITYKTAATATHYGRTWKINIGSRTMLDGATRFRFDLIDGEGNTVFGSNLDYVDRAGAIRAAKAGIRRFNKYSLA